MNQENKFKAITETWHIIRVVCGDRTYLLPLGKSSLQLRKGTMYVAWSEPGQGARNMILGTVEKEAKGNFTIWITKAKLEKLLARIPEIQRPVLTNLSEQAPAARPRTSDSSSASSQGAEPSGGDSDVPADGSDTGDQ